MCTRILTKNYKENFLTSRNMDWFEKFNTNLWAFPSGITRKSLPSNESGSFEWTSKFKSVVAFITLDKEKDGTEIGSTTDGLNEEGFVVNSLYLSESEYGEVEKNNKPKMSMGIWGQYMLDNYATVQDAVREWAENPIQEVLFDIPTPSADPKNVRSATQHISISDSNGDSAIFEYYKIEIEGVLNPQLKLHITTNINISSFNVNEEVSISTDKCNVMTNSPVYSEQLKLNYFWQWQWSNGQDIKGTANKSAKTETLPGTSRAPDRFSRASYYNNNIKKSKTYTESIGQVLSVIRTASVPIGYTLNPNEPNISNTLWTTVSDHSNKIYYFQATDYPNLLWIKLKELDFKNNTKIFKLSINDETDLTKYMGNITKLMTKKEVSKLKFIFS